MPKTTKSKKAPIICAVIIIAALMIFLAAIIFPLLNQEAGGMFAFGMLFLYSFVILAVIAGIIIALRQRLREIEGGEMDDAKKY